MTEIASSGQLRMSFVRWALVTVPLIVFIGSASGILSNSGYTNRWFTLLDLPTIMPPGIAFAVVWPVLYILIGLAFAMILNARGARWRGAAIAAFLIQLVANFAWTPLFFGMHQVTAALALILFILAGAITTTVLFVRVRRLAAWLMLPYLIWLGFASVLNFSIDQANPDAESLAVPAARTNIGGSGQ
jgi:translocator protein